MCTGDWQKAAGASSSDVAEIELLIAEAIFICNYYYYYYYFRFSLIIFPREFQQNNITETRQETRYCISSSGSCITFVFPYASIGAVDFICYILFLDQELVTNWAILTAPAEIVPAALEHHTRYVSLHLGANERCVLLLLLLKHEKLRHTRGQMISAPHTL